MYVVGAKINSFLLLNPTFPAAKFYCFIPVLVSRTEPRGITKKHQLFHRPDFLS